MPLRVETPLAPYLLWAKTRQPAEIDLAGSNLLHCTLDDLPNARAAVDLWAKNDDGYGPLIDGLADHYALAADRFVTANGCSGANFITIAALVGAGDDVLIERPTYDPLIGACLLMGARVRRFDRRFENRFQIDLDALRALVTPATRLIVVTTPHNPSGVSLDRQSLEGLGEIATRAGAFVLVDEVYLDAATAVKNEHGPRFSAARLDGPFVVTNSLTKSYGLAGLRLGWAIASPSVTIRLRRTRDVIDNAGSAPADRLAALAVSQRANLIQRATSILGTNLDLARTFFASHPTLEIAEPPSSSVVFPRIRGRADADPFIASLLDTHGVAVAPGRFFDSPAHFRISLAGQTDALMRGLAKISQALNPAL